MTVAHVGGGRGRRDQSALQRHDAHRYTGVSFSRPPVSLSRLSLVVERMTGHSHHVSQPKRADCLLRCKPATPRPPFSRSAPASSSAPSALPPSVPSDAAASAAPFFGSTPWAPVRPQRTLPLLPPPVAMVGPSIPASDAPVSSVQEALERGKVHFQQGHRRLPAFACHKLRRIFDQARALAEFIAACGEFVTCTYLQLYFLEVQTIATSSPIPDLQRMQ